MISIDVSLIVGVCSIIAVLGGFLLWVINLANQGAVNSERNRAQLREIEQTLRHQMEMAKWRIEQLENYLDRETTFNKRHLPGDRND